jgi:PKD repeat protein
MIRSQHSLFLVLTLVFCSIFLFLSSGKIQAQATADFSFTTNNLAVTFTDASSSSSSAIVSSHYDFGDASVSTMQNPSYVYAASGTYTVCLIASDSTSSDTICKSVTIEHCANDTLPPVLTCPSATIVVNNDPGTCGAAVNYSVSAIDNCSNDTIPIPQRSNYDPPIMWNGSVYFWVWNYDRWLSAENDAQSIGGHLVAINDALENNFIYGLANANGQTIWIGYNDRDTEGDFVWSNGDTTSYTNWNTNEPNNSGNEDVTEFYSFSGRWNDANENNRRYYVVEIEGNFITYDYSRAPGSYFPLGTTTVTCRATDTAGNSDSCSFDIVVNDATPVQLDCPRNETIASCDTANFQYDFAVGKTFLGGYRYGSDLYIYDDEMNTRSSVDITLSGTRVNRIFGLAYDDNTGNLYGIVNVSFG